MSEFPFPKCKKIPHLVEKHGHKLEDPYFWLRQKDNPEVRAYVDAENVYAKNVLLPQESLKQKLFQEMKDRLEPTETGVPVKKGDYFYSYRIPEGQQYAVHFRTRVKGPLREEILLDENYLARGHEFFDLGTLDVSPDHYKLAYAVDVDGSEHYVLKIRNILTGEDYPEQINSASGSVAWCSDSKNLYYVKRASNDRPFQVWRHLLGTSSVEDQLLFEESDSKFFVGLGQSKDHQYVFVVSEAKITSEIWFIQPSKSATDLRCLHARVPGIEITGLDHWKDKFLFLTNDQEQNFRLVQTPDQAPSLKNCEDIIRGNRENFLEDIDVTKDYWIIKERHLGLPRIRVINAHNLSEHFISFDEPTYALGMIGTAEFHSKWLRYSFSSPKTPTKIVDYELNSAERIVKKDTPVGGGFNSENYITERIFVNSHDGIQVPVSLVYRKDLDRSKAHPVMLYGYGSYGHAMSAYMSTSRLSLVDRGFIWAIAHIRGGSDLGRWWYEDGKFLKKKNTFHDFIAAAEGLINKGYTQKGLISIMGGSAGGMLVAAAMNMRPELFKCVVGDVPFVDVINTMLDDTLMLTVTEYDEWGDPNQKEFFEYMLSYSPYDNLKTGSYPHVFLSAGWNDPRVTYWEPAKFAARLRDCRTDERKTLLYTNMGAGHAGASGRFGPLDELAMHFAFILSCYS